MSIRKATILGCADWDKAKLLVVQAVKRFANIGWAMATWALEWLGRGWRAVSVVRAPLTVSIIASLVLSLPGQTQELYRIMAKDLGDGQFAQSLFALFFGVSAAIAVWLIARNVTLIRAGQALACPGVEGALLRWLPRACGALILLGMAIGLWLAAGDVVSLGGVRAELLKAFPALEEIRSRIEKTAVLLRYEGAGVFMLAVTLVGLTYRADSYSQPNRLVFGARGQLLLLVVLAGFLIYFMTLPVAGPQLLGSIAIFLIFVVAVAWLTSVLTTYFDQYGVPAITLVVLLAVLLSVLDTNENHIVRPHEAGWPDYSGVTQPQLVLERWHSERRDRITYESRGEPYPVFVVAASGGGLYAAHHTATFLARMQDRCENFAQHVFAISGVSGGSLGAAVFSSVANEFAKNGEYKPCDFGNPPGQTAETSPGPFEKKVHAVLRNDFLSPLLAATLFPDAVQRFLPWAIESFDRSKALDASLEAAWGKALPQVENPFVRGFREHWRADGAAPALILNTTEVSNGYRVIISPFSPGTETGYWTKSRWLNPLLRSGSVNQDIKLSSAVGISARFPWILPAARVQTWKSVFTLVDAGYVENSGIDTASELIRALEKNNNGRFKFHLIVLGGFSGNPSSDGVGEYYLRELSSPIRAFLSTWELRGDLALFRARDTLCPERCQTELADALTAADLHGRVVFPIEPVHLNLRDIDLPLGWHLSDLSQSIIELHSGDARTCRSGDAFPAGWISGKDQDTRIVDALRVNSCSACMIQYKLAERSWAPKKEMDLLCYRKN